MRETQSLKVFFACILTDETGPSRKSEPKLLLNGLDMGRKKDLAMGRKVILNTTDYGSACVERL